MPKMSRRTIGIILLATGGLLFLLSQNLLVIGLVGAGAYLYYKGGAE